MIAGRRLLGLLLIVCCSLQCQAQTDRIWQAAAAAAMHGDGTALVLEIRSNRLLAAVRPQMAAAMRAAPGSAIKPFVLYALLSSGGWPAERRVACHHTLILEGRDLSCVHPQIEASFDARAALAYSCNQYFAEAALMLSGDELASALRRAGLASVTGLLPGESVSTVRTPRSDAEKQLLALGVEGIQITPLALAESYRWLVLQMARGDASALAPIRDGLIDSAQFGMASGASLAKLQVAGKTGTAGEYAGSTTHGWFVGYAPAEQPQVIVLVYVTHGRGADAASRAREIFATSPLVAQR